MLKFTLHILMVLSLFMSSFAQNSIPSSKKFVVAFPKNDRFSNSFQTINIFVTAVDKDATVTLYQGGATDPLSQIIVPANEIGGFVENPESQGGGNKWGNLSWGIEIEFDESEVVLDKGLVIESDESISVMVMSSKMVTTEAYNALPVESWGRRYIHNSLYDFNEARPWSTGFCVVAYENNTKIYIDYKGTERTPDNDEMQATSGMGKKPGDSHSETLDRGQVFCVFGPGTTRGVFDLSGTEVISNKPIGVISFHERTMIPSTYVNNGRTHMIEMLFPVELWGREFVSSELSRGTDRGDFFRVVAAENDTEFEIKWYDRSTGLEVGNISGVLQANEFYEYNNCECDLRKDPQSDHESIRGYSHFTSNKPIQVMQYSYSEWWDNTSGNFNPFMFNVLPVENAFRHSVFQAPYTTGNQAFNTNILKLHAKGDPNDPARNLELLNSITIDGQSVVESSPAIVGSNIPGTDYFATEINLGPGSHEINSDTPVTAYMYGFSGFFDTYGVGIFGSETVLTNIEINENKHDLSIIPNPSTGNFVLTGNLKLDSKLKLEIFDLKGNLIHSNDSYNLETSIQTNGLSSGNYMLVVYNGDEIILRDNLLIIE